MTRETARNFYNDLIGTLFNGEAGYELLTVEEVAKEMKISETQAHKFLMACRHFGFVTTETVIVKKFVIEV